MAKLLGINYEVIGTLQTADDCMDIPNLVIETLMSYCSKSEMIHAFDAPEESDFDPQYGNQLPDFGYVSGWIDNETNEHTEQKPEPVKILYSSKFREFEVIFAELPPTETIDKLTKSGFQPFTNGLQYTAPRNKAVLRLIANLV
jgi:hypothetical protein